MASRTLTGVVATFPEGTTVGAFPSVGAGTLDRAPAGSPVATAVVTNGNLVFSGMTEGQRYAAHAVVGGRSRFITFVVHPASPGASTTWANVVAGRQSTGTPTESQHGWPDVVRSRRAMAGTS